MGVISTQGYNFRLVANGQQLDLFKDETILVSNNVTGLFDVDILPSDFSRTITLPGTKKNNAFFEHVYDISVNEPYLFETNIKVPSYFDFGGIYLINGYLQLIKVNLYENKFIDSYEVSIFGALSSFSRDLNRTFLTDLTGSLAKYNHVSNVSNITKSWVGNLFSGSVVYPLAEYGQKINYSAEAFFGTDDVEGALNVQNFKPAIRVKAVWDSIFETFGYTYSGSFWQQEWLDDVYLIANNSLKYPEYSNVDLETYGQIKIAAISGSGLNNVTMSANVDRNVTWYNIEKDSSGFVGGGASYKVEKLTKLRGTINLNFKVTATSPGNGAPQFFLDIVPTGSSLPASSTNLVEINQYMQSVVIANTATVNTTYNIPTRFNTVAIPAGTYNFALRYSTYNSPHIQVVLDPGDAPKSYLTVDEVCQAADFRTLNMADNMPYGTNGIKCIDFVKGLQRKFNLMIYPSKTVPNQFIVETFNNWYKSGQIKNFDNYINLNEKIEVIPANNLAVNKLEFGDTLDNDYVSQQFSKGANREYGKTYYIDTQNFFSQGEFKVQSGFASSPLLLVAGSGISGSNGSAGIVTGTNSIYIEDTFHSSQPITCLFTSYVNRTNRTQISLLDSNGNTIVNTGFPISVNLSYTYRGCNGFGQTYRETITIPNGQSTAYYDYTALNYVDCGQGSCVDETITLQCVNSITGQSLPINSNSPFNTVC
jgi:hypothetical protein